MFRSILISLLLLVSSSLEAYSPNPYVDTKVWNSLTPYFLPEDHPIKSQLDKIFCSGKRVVRDKQALKKAGFKIIQGSGWAHIFVVSHPKLKGYLLKLYTDVQASVPEEQRLGKRIFGAQRIQEAIGRYGYHAFFKVPRKWIYPLPAKPSPPKKEKYCRKNFILVVDDMNTLKKQKNKVKWKSEAVSPEILDALYVLFRDVGLSDSTYLANIPFSHDGRIAFVDTEYYDIWPIHFSDLTRSLSEEMREYWIQIVANGGPYVPEEAVGSGAPGF